MKLKFILTLIASFGILSVNAQRPAADHEKAKGGELTIQPITHATLVLSYQGKNIYVDPTGGADAFKGLGAAAFILLTDLSGDHFEPKTIEAIKTAKTIVIAPQAVAEKLPATIDK